MFLDVVLPIKHGVFTYSVPSGSTIPEVGYRVVVPIGNKLYTGVVVRIHDQKPSFKTRPIAFIPKRNPVVSSIQLKIWDWIASYYLCTVGEVVDVALPSILKINSEASIKVKDIFTEEIPDQWKSFIDNIPPKGVTLEQLLKNPTHELSVEDVFRIIDQGVLEIVNNGEKYRPLIEKRYRLSESIFLGNQWQEKYHRSPKKLQFLSRLLLLPRIWRSRTEMIEATEVSDANIKGCVEDGFLEVSSVEISRIDFVEETDAMPIILSDAQKTAYESIKLSFETQKPILLQGVTGSGKTEIYIKLIEEIIQSGKQVLYLLPEIVLSSQIIQRLRRHFGDKVCIYHSRINPSERAEIWFDIYKNNRFKVVVGPRSAIFLPFQSLGLIIVDEEHDPAYKQTDPAPRYNARDVAVVMAKLLNIPIVLGSATPSFESYFNCIQEKYQHVVLSERYGNAIAPKIEIVDYRKWYLRHEVKAHLTPALKSAIDKALEAGEQVILLQNRRGMSPFIQCPKCGYIPMCKRCDISLTLHRNPLRLMCHYCNHTENYPEHCPSCSNDQFRQQGFGTERIEDELRTLYPDKIIERLDSDITRSGTVIEKILNDFNNGDIDILIGTQMVSKGLDFGNLTVVGVLNADNILLFPDFRSSERGFHLLMQFAGRAGRREKQGTVILQTSQPDNYIIQSVKNHQQDEFYQSMLNERSDFFYPPFSRLIMLTIKHSNTEKTQKAAEILKRILEKNNVGIVLGPYTPSIARIKGKFHSQIIIKLRKDSKIHEYRSKVISAIESINKLEGMKSVIIVPDVDPY